jgi:hypothetical protein
MVAFVHPPYAGANFEGKFVRRVACCQAEFCANQLLERFFPEGLRSSDPEVYWRKVAPDRIAHAAGAGLVPARRNAARRRRPYWSISIITT